MGDLLEAVVDADGGLLGVELSVDVPDEEGALPDCRPPDDDRLVVFESALLDLTHPQNIITNQYQPNDRRLSPCCPTSN